MKSVTRKQSKVINKFHDKIRFIESQLGQHKTVEYTDSAHENSKTPNAQTRAKAKNMTKYLQNKSRNTSIGITAAKTQEKTSNRKSYKPFSSIMLKSFSKGNLMKSASKNTKTQTKRAPTYIEKAYRRALESLDSSSSGRNRNSCLESDQSDKTTQRNGKVSDSSNIINMSEEQDDYEVLYTNNRNASQLMYIQEEQEYTTNEGADVLLESSCHCDTEEDKKYDSNRKFIQNY